MRSHVVLQMFALVRLVCTHCTFKWFLARVFQQVTFHVAGVGREVVAGKADVTLEIVEAFDARTVTTVLKKRLVIGENEVVTVVTNVVGFGKL